MIKLTSTALVVLALTAAPFAQVSRQGDGFLIRMAFKKGAKATYSITSTMGGAQTGKAAPPSIKIPLKTEVLSVAKGVGTVKYTIGPMPGGGQKANEQTIQMDSRARPVGRKNVAQLANLGSISLPEKPVRVGQAWTTNLQMPTMMGTMDTKTTYKFQGLKSHPKGQIAVVAMTISGTSAQLNVTGSGTMSLLASDGSLVDLTMKQNMKTKAQGQTKAMDFSTTVKVTRQ